MANTQIEKGRKDTVFLKLFGAIILAVISLACMIALVKFKQELQIFGYGDGKMYNRH